MRRQSNRARHADQRAAWQTTDSVFSFASTLQRKVHCIVELSRKLHINLPTSVLRQVSSGALTLVLLAAGIAPSARAGEGILGLDHVVTLDDKGIWARKYQLWRVESMLAGEVGVGLWEGVTAASATPSGNRSTPPWSGQR
jgi:hypothetical protein